MPTLRKPTTETVIQNCTFTNSVPAVNKHTRAAVEALAKAAEANAEAIKAIADALRGGNAHVGTFIKIQED